MHLKLIIIATLSLTFLGCDHAVECQPEQTTTCQQPQLLHVPSPDWRDQIIYFLMIDRFADGDPSNNDQGVNVYDPNRESHYSGGDLAGIVQRLDYIENLGATAVWTTPQVANQWWDPSVNYSGYHGYWARDFKSVDEHYGSLQDYQSLSHALHTRDMYLIQDIVVNHTGNYFSYKGVYNVDNPSEHFYKNEGSIPTQSPTQPPFDLNNVNDPTHRKAAIYHFTPDINDFSDPSQESTYQTADLDDLNTANPVVIDALKESYGFWIKEAGVDAVRVDTAKYVEPAFFEQFLHGENGLIDIAKQTGRNDFYSFGEIYQTSLPLSNNGEKKLQEFVSDEKAKKLTAPIGFPLYKEISRVFAGGNPTAYLSYRLEQQMSMFSAPFHVANFIDNHDVERFLASGNIAGFKQAYALLMTIPGIPVIYQGDEQLHVQSRRAMFAGGFNTQIDQYDESASMYKFIQKLAKIRKQHPIFSRGTYHSVAHNEQSAGVLVYAREYQGKIAYLVFNTAKDTVLLNNLETEFDMTQPPKLLMDFGMQGPIKFDNSGSVTTTLPAQSFAVFIGNKKLPTSLPEVKAGSKVSFEQVQNVFVDQQQGQFSGTTSEPNAMLKVVLDGKLMTDIALSSDEQGKWSFALPMNDLGEHTHTLEVYWPDKAVASKRHTYTSQYSKVEASADVSDVLNDDNGLSGNYQKPLHSSVGCQMDIEKVMAKTAGSILELSLKMCDVSALWAPPNEFDHVSFTLFFNFPEKSGSSVLPLINSRYPQQGSWNLAHMFFGWANYLYSSQGASEQQEGQKLGVAPDIDVDMQNKTLTISYDGNQFSVNDWRDVEIYITTWDKSGEGNYRELDKTPNVWTFGGGSSSSPLILDDALIKLQSH